MSREIKIQIAVNAAITGIVLLVGWLIKPDPTYLLVAGSWMVATFVVVTVYLKVKDDDEHF